MARPRPPRIRQPDGSHVELLVARARGELLVGAVSRSFRRVDPEALDHCLGRSCARSPNGTRQTSGLIDSWLSGARPSDRTLSTIKPAAVGEELVAIRDWDMWRVLGDAIPDEQIIHSVWRAADEALTRPITPGRRGLLFYDPVDVSAVVAASQLGTPDALLVLTAVARYAQAMGYTKLHALAALGAFDVAVRVMAFSGAFARSSRAFHTALDCSLWKPIDRTVLDPHEVDCDALAAWILQAQMRNPICTPMLFDDVLHGRPLHAAVDQLPSAWSRRVSDRHDDSTRPARWVLDEPHVPTWWACHPNKATSASRAKADLHGARLAVATSRSGPYDVLGPML